MVLYITKFFTLSTLGNCLIFTGDESAASECILRNSDGNRKSLGLMEGVNNEFTLTYCLPSCRILLLKGLSSSCEHSYPAISSGSKEGTFLKACVLFSSLDYPSFFIEPKSSFDFLHAEP